jgi:hypothetical protein
MQIYILPLQIAPKNVMMLQQVLISHLPVLQQKTSVAMKKSVVEMTALSLNHGV